MKYNINKQNAKKNSDSYWHRPRILKGVSVGKNQYAITLKVNGEESYIVAEGENNIEAMQNCFEKVMIKVVYSTR